VRLRRSAGQQAGPSTSPLDDWRCAVPSFAGHLTCTTASARHYEIAVLNILTIAVTALSFESALALGWTKGVTVTSITENNVNGEVVQITVTEIIDNAAHCTNPRRVRTSRLRHTEGFPCASDVILSNRKAGRFVCDGYL